MPDSPYKRESKSSCIKYFNCNEFGHKTSECKKEKTKRKKDEEGETSTKTEPVNSYNPPKGIYKTIGILKDKINEEEFNIFI